MEETTFEVQDSQTIEQNTGRLFNVYGLINHELGAALVEEDYEGFRKMLLNGEAGKILKCVCTSRKNAEEQVNHLAIDQNAIILCDYDEGSEPYVNIIEEHQCYDLSYDETEEEEEGED